MLAGMATDGIVGGATDYIGQNTNLGKQINQVGNIYQGFNGQPQSPILGNPAPQQGGGNSFQQSMPSKDDIIQKVLGNNPKNPSGVDDTTQPQFNQTA